MVLMLFLSPLFQQQRKSHKHQQQRRQVRANAKTIKTTAF
jgi:hypothetical protein